MCVYCLNAILLQLPFNLFVYSQQYGTFYCQLYFFGCGYAAQVAAVPWRSFV